ncbi:alpha/beta hydrolase family protein [Pacificimonas pallii]|nr:S9 family peptidase [Pacificimonas pallii]
MTAATALLAAAVMAFPAIARPMTPEDLAGLNRMSDAAVSPDGKLLVFSMRETDFEADRGRTDLFALDLTTDGAAPVRWNTDPGSDGGQVFSRDGTMLYWLSSRSGDAQVWRAAVAGGEPQQVTDVKGGIDGFHLAPSENQLAYWKDVTPEAAELPGDGRVYDRLFARHWDTWDQGGKNELFTIALGANGLPVGDAVAISAALDGDVPGKPFGGGDDISFAPDGKTIYFALREKGTTEAWSTDLDIWSAPTDGSAAPVNLTDGDDGTDTHPVVSPDGKYLAYASMARAGYESDQLVLKIRDLETGAVRALTEDWNLSVDGISWMPGSDGLILTAADGWNTPIFRIGMSGAPEKMTALDGNHSVIAMTDGNLVYSLSSLTEPGDVYMTGPTVNPHRRLTAINADKLKDVELGEVSRFSFAGANDEEVFGYVVKPAGLADGEEAPTVLWSHGGPQGRWSNSWSSRWNPQAWAGAGYAIVTVDFHGSSGYGQDFQDSINNDWGGKPLVDLQKGLAAAREQYAFLNDEKACAAGGSYGGYMMNWIAGEWPDGMACLVNHAGLFDMRSFYYSTEELWFPEWDFGGPYYDRVEAYEKWNPATRVKNWKTPMLVIQGVKDYRVPYTQSLMAYTAAQRQGVDSRLLVFDDENHWILKPNNSLQWHREVFRWLDEHLAE